MRAADGAKGNGHPPKILPWCISWSVPLTPSIHLKSIDFMNMKHDARFFGWGDGRAEQIGLSGWAAFDRQRLLIRRH